LVNIRNGFEADKAKKGSNKIPSLTISRFHWGAVSTWTTSFTLKFSKETCRE